MIALLLLVIMAALLIATPWRRLPLPARLWALTACLNAFVSFTMPTTVATSPWRPVVARVLALCSGVSVALVVLGFVLWRRYAVAASARSVWIGPLIHRRPPVLALRLFLGHRPALLSGSKLPNQPVEERRSALYSCLFQLGCFSCFSRALSVAVAYLCLVRC